MFELFGDPQHSFTDQVLRAYEYPDKWVNRMILGDSLVVMNSLLHYEGQGGQVQMIYIDPPYGVKFGSNFQPFVRKRDVSHNDDEDMTREPEMVQAYRDTWELGLHSYLTYLRDRLLVARELLASTGSIFVQISDENVHHVRELLDEVFGSENFLSVITVRKTTSEGRTYLGTTADFLLLYAKDHGQTKYRQLFSEKSEEAESRYDQVMLLDSTYRPATEGEMAGTEPLPPGARLFRVDNITSSRPAGEGDVREFEY
ncbi:MAG TPA: DNA methyltransferase, partial [Terriglobia bacterium]|nr:DNA methyltransferase [Terriglobia bacterium]